MALVRFMVTVKTLTLIVHNHEWTERTLVSDRYHASDYYYYCKMGQKRAETGGRHQIMVDLCSRLGSQAAPDLEHFLDISSSGSDVTVSLR